MAIKKNENFSLVELEYPVSAEPGGKYSADNLSKAKLKQYKNGNNIFDSGSLGSDTLVNDEQEFRGFRLGLGIKSVIGDDDRKLVVDTRALPFRMICCLDLHFAGGRKYRGTGALVSPNLILTCAHNCYHAASKKHVRKIVVSPGKSGADTPFGYAIGTKVFFPSEYETDPTVKNDYALCHLDRNIGKDIGYCGVVIPTDKQISDSEIHLTGYPTDKDKTGNTMYTHSDSVSEYNSTHIYYQTDTNKGYSGGPAYLLDSGEKSVPVIVAIHVEGDSEITPGETNVARRIDQDVHDNIVNWARR